VGSAPANGSGRRRVRQPLLAAAAATLGTDGTDNAPLHRQHIKHLVAVLPKRAKGTAAIRTITGTCLRFNAAFIAWQMIRQSADGGWPSGFYDPLRRLSIGNSSFALQFIERQFRLRGLMDKLLRRLAKGHTAQLVQLSLQGLDQRVTGSESSF